MLTRVALAAVLGVAILSAACDSSPSYDTDGADDDYDLELMLLRNMDLPVGVLERFVQSFDNDEWSQVVGGEDPEAQKEVLDRTGRVKGTVAIYSADDPSQQLAAPLSFTSQSTLYKDEDLARKALTDPRASCGTLNSDPSALPDDFQVPRIGQESIGFTVLTDSEVGRSVDTTVCFRTGRIVHAVVQTGFNGSQDIALAVRLAERQLKRVENTLDGRPDPKEEPQETADNG